MSLTLKFNGGGRRSLGCFPHRPGLHKIRWVFGFTGSSSWLRRSRRWKATGWAIQQKRQFHTPLSLQPVHRHFRRYRRGCAGVPPCHSRQVVAAGELPSQGTLRDRCKGEDDLWVAGTRSRWPCAGRQTQGDTQGRSRGTWRSSQTRCNTRSKEEGQGRQEEGDSGPRSRRAKGQAPRCAGALARHRWCQEEERTRSSGGRVRCEQWVQYRRFRLCTGRVEDWCQSGRSRSRAGHGRCPETQTQEARWGPQRSRFGPGGFKRLYFRRLEWTTGEEGFASHEESEEEEEEEGRQQDERCCKAFISAHQDPQQRSQQVKRGSEGPEEKEVEEEEEDPAGWDDCELQRQLLLRLRRGERAAEQRRRSRSPAPQTLKRSTRLSTESTSEPCSRTTGSRSGDGTSGQQRPDHRRGEDYELLQPPREALVPWSPTRTSRTTSLVSRPGPRPPRRYRSSSRRLIGKVHRFTSKHAGWVLEHSQASGAAQHGGRDGRRAHCNLSGAQTRPLGGQGARDSHQQLAYPRGPRCKRRERQGRVVLWGHKRRQQERQQRQRKRQEGKEQMGFPEPVGISTKERLVEGEEEAGGETQGISPLVLVKAVAPEAGQAFCLKQVLAVCTTLERTGCALAWTMLHVADLEGKLKNSMLFLMLASSGARHRAERRRSALPIRVGDLAGLIQKLGRLSLPEVVKEEFAEENAGGCWTYLACCACNALCGQRGLLLGGGWTSAERRAHDTVHSMAKRLLGHGGDSSVVDTSGIEKDIRLTKVNYAGEEMGTCHKLTLRQIGPALPPTEHGGSVELLNFVSPSTRQFLENPELCILPDQGQKLPKLQGRIHIEKGELPAVTKALTDCGVCSWIPLDQVLRYRDQYVLNGLFGVPKSTTIDSGEPILRVIMNLVPSNSIMLQLQGSVKNLPSITSWMSTVTDEGEQVKIWQSDMSNAFYLFSLPIQWRRCLAFNIVEAGEHIGLEVNKKYALCCCVLPMGWLSSVAVMQEISESLLLRGSLPSDSQITRQKGLPLWMVGLLREAKRDRRAWWHVYLDNYAGGQLVDIEEHTTEGDKLHDLAEQAWKEAHIISSDKKRKRGVDAAEELGALVCGKTNTVGASPSRLLKVIHATLWILARPHLTKKHVQIVAGRWVHILQFRRPGMSFLESTWEYIGSKRFSSTLVLKVRRELWDCICAAPLLHTNLAAEISRVVTASDASQTGGAVGIARNLTAEGQNFVEAELRQQTNQNQIPVLVVSLFHGIGGSFRCYDILGVSPVGMVYFEINELANRIVSRRWPQAVQYGDVRLCDAALIRNWLLTYTGIEEIHLWAGFPCTDLTSVKAFREGLQGEQSKLFYEVPRILRLLKQQAGERIKVKYVGENVASMGKPECDEISNTLGVWPYHLNCADAVPMNRPRLCWCSEWLEGCLQGLEFHDEEHWTALKAFATYPEIDQWLEKGAHWPGGEQGEILPTALRAIIRTRPPPRPAGISRCDQDTLERWAAECYKFPPYHYQSRFIVWKGEKWRLTDSSERELLLGYGFGHTEVCMSASNIKQSQAKYENQRLSLLGDSFSIFSFVIPAAALCARFLPELSYQHLASRMGMAPGYNAPWRTKAPLSRHLLYGDLGLAPINVSCQDLNRLLLTKVNHTGSDVRITTGQILNPKAFPRQSVESSWWQWEHLFKFRWQTSEHINLLELRAIQQAVVHSIGRLGLTNARIFHVSDSYVCLSIVSKGRSGSRFMNRVLKVLNAHLLAHGVVLVMGHVESTKNPTDHASRST